MKLDDLKAAIDPEWAGTLPPRRAFTRAGRLLGHGQLADGWTTADAGRAVLLAGMTPEEITTVYQEGDAGERLAVLKALPLLDIGDAGVPLLHDALRTNDTRLVATALGPYAGHLDDDTWRQGVIKCVFMGVPLSAVDRLDERADAALVTSLRALAEERAAAGRDMPADALALLDRKEAR